MSKNKRARRNAPKDPACTVLGPRCQTKMTIKLGTIIIGIPGLENNSTKDRPVAVRKLDLVLYGIRTYVKKVAEFCSLGGESP